MGEYVNKYKAKQKAPEKKEPKDCPDEKEAAGGDPKGNKNEKKSEAANPDNSKKPKEAAATTATTCENIKKDPPPLGAESLKRPYRQPGMVEFPKFGPRHANLMKAYLPSAIIYSISGILLTVWMSEWKTVLQYLPYYNGKYPPEPEE